MTAIPQERTLKSAHATLAAAKRHGNEELAAIAKDELHLLKLEKAVADAVSSAPAITTDQRLRIISLLSGGALNGTV